MEFSRIRKHATVVLLIIGIVLLFSKHALAQEEAREVHNKRLVQDAFDAWRDGTGNPFDLLADNASWTIVGNSVVAKTYATKAEFLSVVIKPFNARLAGHLVPTIRGIYADHSTVITYFDGDGIALDRKPYHNSYVWLFDFRGGKVVKAVAFFDSVEFNDFWNRVKPQDVPVNK